MPPTNWSMTVLRFLRLDKSSREALQPYPIDNLLSRWPLNPANVAL